MDDALQQVSKLPIGCGPLGTKLKTLTLQPCKKPFSTSAWTWRLETESIIKRYSSKNNYFWYLPKFQCARFADLISKKVVGVKMISGYFRFVPLKTGAYGQTESDCYQDGLHLYTDCELTLEEWCRSDRSDNLYEILIIDETVFL